MIPPDRSGFKRESNAQQALSTLQQVVRYAEKDDLLLYVTAAFGVLMPGVMYLFYRHVHNRYQQNKKAHKNEQKQRKRQSKQCRTSTIFYSSDCPLSKELAYKLAENLQFDPLVAKLGAHELEKACHQKAFHLFVLSDDAKETPSQFAEFVDWLDEVRYERQQKNYLLGTRFLILYSEARNSSGESFGGDHVDQMAALEKRLRSLEAKPLGQAETVDMKGSLLELYTRINETLRRFNYGEFDSPEAADESIDETEDDR